MKRSMSRNDPTRVMPEDEAEPGTIVRTGIWIFSKLLRLYPGHFYASFAGEMLDVFSEAITESAQGGFTPVLRFWSRELAELPLALISQHFYDRRKQAMQLLRYDNQHEIGAVRSVARVLSILTGGFVVMLYLFNDDLRAEPTPPSVMLGLLPFFMLIAWRWERFGGLLTMFGSVLLAVTMLFQWSGAVGLITPIPLLIFIAGGMTLSFLIIGWLFVSIAQHTRAIQEHAGDEETAVPRKRRTGVYLVIGLLGFTAILLFLVPMIVPVQQRMEAPSFNNLAYDQLIAELRTQGAVVGVGSVPAENTALSVGGLEINVNGEIVHAFEYVDIAAATADLSAIYYGKNPVWDGINWIDTPRLYQVNNVLVLYVGSDKGIMGILENAFSPPIVEGA